MQSSLLLPFTIEAQAGRMLCWAAVCVSLKRYYRHSPLPDQVRFARDVIGEKFDQVCAPGRALTAAGLRFDALRGEIPFEHVRNHIASGNPVLACMRYFVGWHLVVLYGVRDEHEIVVADPLHGGVDCSYDVFRSAYRDHYCWSDTLTLAGNEPS